MVEAKRRPVIVDCDPGIDDILAFLVLLADPSIRILAITTSFGNTSASNGFSNALKLFANLVRHVKARPDLASHWPHLFEDHIILMQGLEEPRGGDKIDAGYFHGRDGLSDISKSDPRFTPSAEEVEALYDSGVLARPDPTIKDAPDLILSLLKQHQPREVGLLTIGPLTTLAATLARDRDFFLRHCGLIVSMGGALESPGNTTSTAEFNFRADAFAVHECLRGGLGDAANKEWSPRWLLLPLDVTGRHTFPFELYAQKVDRYFNLDRPTNTAKEPLVDFLKPIMLGYQRVMNAYGLDAIELHDPAAAWCMACLLGRKGDQGWQIQRRLFDIERKGELTVGMLVVDRRTSSKKEKGRARNDSQHDHPAPARIPSHGGPPPVQMKPSEVEVVVESPGIEKLREVMLRSCGPLSSNVPIRR